MTEVNLSKEWLVNIIKNKPYPFQPTQEVKDMYLYQLNECWSFSKDKLEQLDEFALVDLLYWLGRNG